MIEEICHKNVKVYYYIFPPHNIAPLFYIFAFFLYYQVSRVYNEQITQPDLGSHSNSMQFNSVISRSFIL